MQNEHEAAARRRCKAHEGLRLRVYDDSRGFATIGYGHLWRPGEPRQITQAQADSMFNADWRTARQATDRLLAEHEVDVVRLGPVRLFALVEMVFQLGEHHEEGFSGMFDALHRENYAQAAMEMLYRDPPGPAHSAWWVETPDRAEELARIMTTGVYEP